MRFSPTLARFAGALAFGLVLSSAAMGRPTPAALQSEGSPATAPSDTPPAKPAPQGETAALAPAKAGPAVAVLDLGGPIDVSREALARASASVGATAPEQGLTIPESAIQLALVQSLGSNELESRKVDIFIEREINRRVLEGADPAQYGVNEAELDQQVATLREQVKAQYPTLEVDFVLGQNGIMPGTLRSLTAQNQLFTQVFLPDNPADWPVLTRDAILTKFGEPFVQQLQTAHETRVAEGTVNDPAAQQGQALFKKLLRDTIVQTLAGGSDIKTTASGLPPGVALRVDGIDIMTADVFASIAPRLTADDVRKARLWVAKREVVKAVLEAAGAYLDDEAFAAAFAEHEAPYAGSMLTLEMVVRQFKRFPSMDHYREHFRLQTSFERMAAESLDREALEAHLPRAQRLLGLETVDAEVILISAYDFPTGRWKENGWQAARERAKAVAGELAEADGENWTAMLEQHSDFWDPPVATNAAQPQQPTRPDKGRFGSKNRNELVQALGESEFLMFVEGSSVADALFFDVEAGGLGGPWRGPFGYYIGLVKSRTPAKQAVTLDGDRYEDLIRQDLLSVRFNAFAQAMAKNAGILPKS